MMKNRLFYLLTLMLTMLTQGAWAEEQPQAPQFKYIERSWDGTKVVDTEKTITDYEILSGTADPDAWALLGSNDDSDDHYYVVVGGTNVTYKTLNVYGKAHLILCDGATLTCTGGIMVEKGHNNAQLFIYGQSGDTGRLIVTNSYNNMAGIGSSMAKQGGEITIHGGTLDITGGKRGAGIGGGGPEEEYKAAVGLTKIFGGHVKAQGGDRGAGIGGGPRADGGTLYLYGGEVEATGGDYAAGVGGGGYYDPNSYLYDRPKPYGGWCGSVYVYTCKLTAKGGEEGAGIGSGKWATEQSSDTGLLHVYDGATVIAIGGKQGAGIGGGEDSRGIKTYIDGGTVIAKGGENGAGIGSGVNVHKGKVDGGETHIAGGVVRAEGTSYGAGIGGGKWGIGGDVYITGGTVTAIAGELCNCRDQEGGSAIGCGRNVSDKDADDSAHALEIGSTMRVTGGDAENNIERVFTSAERNPACRWRNYVKLEPCPHTAQNGDAVAEAITYSIVDESFHDRYCRYCQTVSRESHATTGECPCGMEGYSFTTYVPSSSTGGSGYLQKQTYKVKAGNEFYLPECDDNDVPTGYKFLGWEMSPNTTETGYDNWAAVKGGDIGGDNKLAAGTSVKALLGMTPATFYARYLYDFNDEWQWNADCTKCTLILSCDAKPSWTYQVVLTQNDAIVREYLDDCVEYSISYTYTDDVHGYKYKFSTKKQVPYVLTLQNNANNSTAIEQYDKKTATVCLKDRTLYTDGKWNTLCLPFSVDEADFDYWLGIGRGKEVKTLTSSSFDNGVLTLNFDDADKIVAGKPYLIRWEFNADDKAYYSNYQSDFNTFDADANITYYEFVPTVIDNTLRPTETTYIDFVGSFSPVDLTADDKTTLFLGAGNTLYYPSDDMTIGACRAVFVLKGLTAGEAEARAFVLNFGEDSEQTNGIVEMRNEEGEIRNVNGEMRNDSAVWYTLDGRKVNSHLSPLTSHPSPLKKGLYINNGKKVVIK